MTILIRPGKPTDMSNRYRHRRKGAVLVLMVLLLPVTLMLCAFAVNMAYMELNRTELYSAADAAARASGREFTITRSQALAVARGKEFAKLNDIAGDPMTLESSDFVFGTGSRPTISKYSFTPGGPNPNAVEVTARRVVGAPDGPIELLMPNLMGVTSFQAQRSSVSTQVEVDIALVIDRSGSMAYGVGEVAAYPPIPASAPSGWAFCDPVPPNSRWLNVVAAVDVFLDELATSPSNELVSLSTYNHASTTEQALTSDYDLIRAGLVPYTNSFCAGGTNIGGGINEGASTLALSPNARSNAVKVIVLLTDGIHNTGYNPERAANAAVAGGVVIHTITFSDEAEQRLMRKVASVGGGKHFHATSASDLIAIFQEIAKQLPTLLTR